MECLNMVRKLMNKIKSGKEREGSPRGFILYKFIRKKMRKRVWPYQYLPSHTFFLPCDFDSPPSRGRVHVPTP